MKKFLFAISCMFIVTGCNNTVINQNPYYQTNYDSGCVYEGVTWTELVLCQQKDLDQEWEQNNITNNLLNKKK